jgi:hypothetical protein
LTQEAQGPRWWEPGPWVEQEFAHEFGWKSPICRLFACLRRLSISGGIIEDKEVGIADEALDAASLLKYLPDCGYDSSLLRVDYEFQHGSATQRVPWAAFSQNPPDARSACLAAVDVQGASLELVLPFRSLGTPILFACSGQNLLWFQHDVMGSRLLEAIAPRQVPGFFRAHREEFSPQRIYRAKTSAKFQVGHQLDFVDFGLMPALERESGRRLGNMVEGLVAEVHEAMPNSTPSRQFARWLFQSVFWLLAARLLRDKKVPSFKTVNVADPDDVFDRVSRHYNAKAPVVGSARERAAITAAAKRAAGFGPLGNVTTESLAYVYENTLVSAEAREALGTHSTPPWLVDYVVWQLAPWIEELPAVSRHVLEPASGHSAFLVAAVRLLRELQPGVHDDKARLRYLREHIHGIEVDEFAREIGRLSLTLADVPNSNGWDLAGGDMFIGSDLGRQVKRGGVILSNPPFEDFTAGELRHYKRSPGLGILHTNKAVELVARIVENMPEGGVFGLVVPQSVLTGANGRSLRERALKGFELREVCLFPDGVFENSSVESAVILGRRRMPQLRSTVYYRRVREWDMAGFEERLEASAESRVPQSSFLLTPGVSLKLPDLPDVWEYLSSLPHLGERVSVQKGFEFKSRIELKGREVESSKKRPDWRRAVLRAADEYPIWELPRVSWIDYSPATLRERGGGAKPGHPQVLVNYAPASRKPWRLKAVIDSEGLAVASRFLVFRPRLPSPSLEVLWAILNSPMANAFAFSVSGKRQTLPKEWKRFPLPHISEERAAAISVAAKEYNDAIKAKARGFFSGPDDEGVRQALMRMDAKVLSVYGLPPDLEEQVLRLFDGVDRPGVGCKFTSYPAAPSASHLPFSLRLMLDRFHVLAGKKAAKKLKSEEADELREIERAFDHYEAAAPDGHGFRNWLNQFDRKAAASRARLDALEAMLEREGRGKPPK